MLNSYFFCLSSQNVSLFGKYLKNIYLTILFIANNLNNNKNITLNLIASMSCVFFKEKAEDNTIPFSSKVEGYI